MARVLPSAVEVNVIAAFATNGTLKSNAVTSNFEVFMINLSSI
jgi:hypothetical protein